MEMNKTKEKAEDLVLKLRELVGKLRQCVPAGDRDAQRQQLKVIGDSVLQMEQKKIPVPEDLRKLKSRLEGEFRDAEKYQVILYFLREQLSEVLAEIGGVVRKGTPNGVTQKQVQRSEN
jgi:hypothetical protein